MSFAGDFSERWTEILLRAQTVVYRCNALDYWKPFIVYLTSCGGTLWSLPESESFRLFPGSDKFILNAITFLFYVVQL